VGQYEVNNSFMQAGSDKTEEKGDKRYISGMNEEDGWFSHAGWGRT